jgi:hypothetical protein
LMWKDTAKLLKLYLGIVRPLERRLVRMMTKTSNPEKTGDLITDYANHIWIDLQGQWDSEKCTRLLRKAFRCHTDIDVGLANYRHISLAMMRKFLNAKLALRLELKDLLVEVLAETQAGHSDEVGKFTYARDELTHAVMDEKHIQMHITVRFFTLTVQGTSPE